ncbi:DUF3108 domain-containing protein [Pelagicoccus sp. SDUM812003]|uniref:DUF3108 domain-containing protein n=1 Tax=Pelagicoccus sp. SDUM812003 TaxID=3041267 RepID=UPI00280E4879|nr:DUF3108 domain-containing protein [Pelagicoccus sp. SDUM812003]MDQ8203127.1 DUF3108 domain-containing protein [Pelagicoccus sp. SDUM812003]
MTSTIPDRRLFARWTIAALLLLGCASASAGINGDEFDESTEPDVPDEIEWPEARFADPMERGRAFQPGNEFLFRAQWGIFRKAGSIAITVESASHSDQEEESLQVIMETASAGVIRSFYPMDLESRTSLDPREFRVVRDEVDGIVRSKESRTVALFDYDEGKVVYTDELEPERNKIKKLPYDVTLDYASCILQLRSWDLAVGSRYQMCVNSKGKFYFVELEAVEKDRIRTEFGARDCFRIEPVRVFPQSKTFREGGKMAIWITDDAERIPVRVDVKTSFGTARMLLEEYQLADTQELAKK